MFNLTNTFLKIWALDALNPSKFLFVGAGIISLVFAIVCFVCWLDDEGKGSAENTRKKCFLIPFSLAFLFFVLAVLTPNMETTRYAKIAIIANDCSGQALDTEICREAEKSILLFLKEINKEKNQPTTKNQ